MQFGKPTQKQLELHQYENDEQFGYQFLFEKRILGCYYLPSPMVDLAVMQKIENMSVHL